MSEAAEISGFLQKTDSSGTKWKRRFVKAAAATSRLAWYSDDPESTRGGSELGSVYLVGAMLTVRPPPPVEATSAEARRGYDHCLKVVTAERMLLLAFPTGDALEYWRSFLARCTTAKAASAAAGAASPAGKSSGAGMGGKSDFAGWLLKAAPGWRTFQNRFIVLDADKGTLRYFDGGPTTATLERLLNITIPPGFDALKIPPVEGDAAREVLFSIEASKEKGDILLSGASVSISSTGDGSAPAFAVTNEEGRVFAFVGISADSVALWVSRIGRIIAEQERLRPVLGKGTPYAGFLASMDERGSGYMNKVDSSGTRWSYRFFALRGSVMSYYTDHSRSELKGSFRIGPGSSIKLGHQAATKNAPTEFKITLAAHQDD